MNPRTKYINHFTGHASGSYHNANFSHGDSDNIKNILSNEKVIIIAEDTILENLQEIRRDIDKIKEVQIKEINELKKQIFSQYRHQLHFFNLIKQKETPMAGVQKVRKRSISM